MTGLIAALDTADLGCASAWAAAVAPHVGSVKVGLELFAAHGAAALRVVPEGRVFLDLKLHDIPNTVAGAARAAAAHRPAMLTVHAAGGAAMVAAAREAIDELGGTLLLAVTVLTSGSDSGLREMGVSAEVPAQVLRLARLALGAGAHGLVCAPAEVAMLRDAFGSVPVLVVPGIRPVGSAVDDQARTATPRAAAMAGADWVVVGRPIFRAADPAAAAAAIAAELRG